MLLVADAGNTNITFGVFAGQQLTATFRLSNTAGVSFELLRESLSAELIAAGLTATNLTASVLGSVARTSELLIQVLAAVLGHEPLVVASSPAYGMRIAYADPATLGVDRLANALAAYDRLGCAAIIVDLGTATNFDCVSQDGEFLGGAICAGPQLSLDALSVKSSRLKHVMLAAPPAVLANDTRGALLSGAYFGQAAMVDGMVARLQGALGSACPVIATGGYSPLIAPECRSVSEVRTDLTLQGLRLMWQKTVRAS